MRGKLAKQIRKAVGYHPSQSTTEYRHNKHKPLTAQRISTGNKAVYKLIKKNVLRAKRHGKEAS